ncbi:MAG: hypothetical protein ACE5OZ_17570 [Candidatus Heimdallarchaeota archaeon]
MIEDFRTQETSDTSTNLHEKEKTNAKRIRTKNFLHISDFFCTNVQAATYPSSDTVHLDRGKALEQIVAVNKDEMSKKAPTSNIRSFSQGKDPRTIKEPTKIEREFRPIENWVTISNLESTTITSFNTKQQSDFVGPQVSEQKTDLPTDILNIRDFMESVKKSIETDLDLLIDRIKSKYKPLILSSQKELRYIDTKMPKSKRVKIKELIFYSRVDSEIFAFGTIKKSKAEGLMRTLMQVEPEFFSKFPIEFRPLELPRLRVL